MADGRIVCCAVGKTGRSVVFLFALPSCCCCHPTSTAMGWEEDHHLILLLLLLVRSRSRGVRQCRVVVLLYLLFLQSASRTRTRAAVKLRIEFLRHSTALYHSPPKQRFLAGPESSWVYAQRVSVASIFNMLYPLSRARKIIFPPLRSRSHTPHQCCDDGGSIHPHRCDVLCLPAL